jgi:hypothetical protein
VIEKKNYGNGFPIRHLIFLSAVRSDASLGSALRRGAVVSQPSLMASQALEKAPLSRNNSQPPESHRRGSRGQAERWIELGLSSDWAPAERLAHRVLGSWGSHEKSEMRELA